MRNFGVTPFALIAMGLIGCAAIAGAIAPGEIKSISAAVMNVPEQDITDVSSVEQGVTTSSWTVTLRDGRHYKCLGSDTNIRIDTTRCTPA